jgi:acetyl esterase/lipase
MGLRFGVGFWRGFLFMFFRHLVLMCAVACVSVSASTQVAAPLAGAPANRPATTSTFPPGPGQTLVDHPANHPWVPLWPEGAPGAVGKADVDVPAVGVYIAPFNPTHTLVVIAPGGGYVHLSLQKEGSDVALWLNQHNVSAIVLRYRLGPTYHHPTELEDAQRAIRYARAHAAEWGVQTDHIGMWGFSAGGHLTATAGTHFDAGNPAATDPIDRLGSRPDFLVLAYPVISFDPAVMHAGSRKYLLGDTPDPALVTLLSNELQVTPQTPPTFLFSTTDDGTVPIANTVLFYSALVKAKVPVELHIFRHGAHGAGLAPTNPELSIWPELLLKWMQVNGWAGQ